MSARDQKLLQQELIAGARVPAGNDRADRVRLLREAFTCLVEGRLPSHEAAMLTGGGGLAWLEAGADLLRDHWQVLGPSGSHHTPQALAARLRESSSGGAQDAEDVGTVTESLPAKDES